MLPGNSLSARPTYSLLEKQKQMAIQEAEALERSTVSNPQSRLLRRYLLGWMISSWRT
jgi:hypothetical protein